MKPFALLLCALLLLCGVAGRASGEVDKSDEAFRLARQYNAGDVSVLPQIEAMIMESKSVRRWAPQVVGTMKLKNDDASFQFLRRIYDAVPEEFLKREMIGKFGRFTADPARAESARFLESLMRSENDIPGIKHVSYYAVCRLGGPEAMDMIEKQYQEATPVEKNRLFAILRQTNLSLAWEIAARPDRKSGIPPPFTRTQVAIFGIIDFLSANAFGMVIVGIAFFVSARSENLRRRFFACWGLMLIWWVAGVSTHMPFEGMMRLWSLHLLRFLEISKLANMVPWLGSVIIMIPLLFEPLVYAAIIFFSARAIRHFWNRGKMFSE